MSDYRADTADRTHRPRSMQGIEISGLVGRPMMFSQAALAELHSGLAVGLGSSTTALLDLFGEVKLSRRADVLVVTHGTAAPSPIAIPVSAAASPDAFVELSDAGLRLEVPRWSSPGRPVWFLSLHACTFTEFVGCR
ncbi:MAG: hypothetical protein ACE37B_23425 [Ilumatobacter sp.]|uniref:hypothetical protein n=1 Tax=Ilumatobacter sp. TaxID=1967498 RepID=UPI003919E1C7